MLQFVLVDQGTFTLTVEFLYCLYIYSPPDTLLLTTWNLLQGPR